MTIQSNTEKFDAKRSKAILAAATVFASKGYHGASTQDIAEEMGIKQGSLYYYFDSKETALEEVCIYGLDSYVKRMEKISSKGQPFESRLLAILTSHLSSYREKNAAMKVHNDQRLYLPKARRAKLKKLGSRYRALLVDTLKSGVDEKTLKADTDLQFLSQSIIGLCNFWGAALLRDSKLDMYETIQHCADLILEGSLAPRNKATTQ
jgi:AcrR family transcriptional regulator